MDRGKEGERDSRGVFREEGKKEGGREGGMEGGRRNDMFT
jgi:hypothetical protein